MVFLAAGLAAAFLGAALGLGFWGRIMSAIKVESGVSILMKVHTGAGSGAKSELPPSSSKTESSFIESSMIEVSD